MPQFVVSAATIQSTQRAMQLSSVMLLFFCVVGCNSGKHIKLPFNYLSPSSLLSKGCRDLKMYPTTKLVGGQCFDRKSKKNGILRAEKQCHYNVSGVTPNIIGYLCCEPIVCCPNPFSPTNTFEHCEYIYRVY